MLLLHRPTRPASHSGQAASDSVQAPTGAALGVIHDCCRFRAAPLAHRVPRTVLATPQADLISVEPQLMLGALGRRVSCRAWSS